MGHFARGEAWIPLEDWHEFVQKYMPASPAGIISLGPPREQEGEIVVPFAINTECPPMDEADPPEWCKKR